MSFLYYLFSSLLVVLSATMLLVKRLKTEQYLLMIIYVLVMAYTAGKWGQIMGLLTIVGLAVIVIIVSDEYKLENACLVCIGYLFNVTFNTLLCLLLVEITGISVAELDSHYWFQFSACYILLLWIVMKCLRYMLYEKLKLIEHINHIQKPVRYGLFVNMLVYGLIFFVNLACGQKAGYSIAALRLNAIVFIICMVISAFLIVICVSDMKSIEQRKADERQRIITENYIIAMEHIMEELRAFKHDYKNIMSEMAGYIREGQIEELKEYYYKLIQTEEVDRYKELYVWKSLRNIQPMELKGVLYEKVLSILSKNINLRVRIEKDLWIKYPDIQIVNRILGIFIDNATEAALETEEKYVSIEVSQIDNMISFCIANSTKELPDFSKIFQKGYSTKGQNRGMGLYWVRSVLKKREELVHEMDIIDNRVIQKLDIPNR